MNFRNEFGKLQQQNAATFQAQAAHEKLILVLRVPVAKKSF